MASRTLAHEKDWQNAKKEKEKTFNRESFPKAISEKTLFVVEYAFVNGTINVILVCGTAHD